MPHINNEDGSKSGEFIGFDLEPGIWNVGLLGEWSTHTTYTPITNTESYSYAKEKYDLAENLTSCGVRVVLCYGNTQVEPYNLDENGEEIPPCCIDDTCDMCIDWLKSCDSLEYCPERDPLKNPWGSHIQNTTYQHYGE